LSVSHKIGASPPNLPKKQKPKSVPQNHEKTIYGAYPPNLPKKQKPKSVPQNHQKNYFWRIATQLAKKTKNKVDSTKSSERLFLGHPHPTCHKNKKQSWLHRIIRKTISVVHNNLR